MRSSFIRCLNYRKYFIIFLKYKFIFQLCFHRKHTELNFTKQLSEENKKKIDIYEKNRNI